MTPTMFGVVCFYEEMGLDKSAEWSQDIGTGMTDEYDKITELLQDFDEVGRGYIHTYCVFHEDDKKSLMIYPDARGYTPGFYCLSGECNQKGSLTYLLRVLEGAPPVPRGDEQKEKPPYLPSDLDKLSELASDAHLALLAEPERRHYLKQRGVDAIIEPALLGWYKGWITVPIFHNKRLSGLYARATPAEQERTGQRFTQPLGQRPMRYSPVDTIAKPLYLVFGMFDALALATLGLSVVTTSGGSASFDADWVSDYRDTIVVVPDASGDSHVASTLAAQLGWRGKIMRLEYDDDVHDPADFLAAGRGDELLEMLGG